LDLQRGRTAVYRYFSAQHVTRRRNRACLF
jgi:hypothetical protein